MSNIISTFVYKLIKTNKMEKGKALERLSSLENEAKELRKIIETCDEPRTIMDRVKSFEGACRVLCISTDLSKFGVFEGDEREQYIALYKLKIIIKALNEGWWPNWKNSNERKYWPRFDMSTSLPSFSSVYYHWSNTNTHVSSSLCLKSEELAKYMGIQFPELYSDLLK